MSELFEFKLDFEKYKGMTAEEMERAIAEDRRRAIEADPRTIAAARSAERWEAERQRRIEEDRRQQQAEAAAALEEQKQRCLRSWIASGGTEAEFETEWPAMKRRIIAEKVEKFEREREWEAFTV